MAAISSDDGLEVGSEGPAGLDNEVPREFVPGSHDAGLQGLHAVVRGGPGGGIHNAPDSIIKGAMVWLSHPTQTKSTILCLFASCILMVPVKSQNKNKTNTRQSEVSQGYLNISQV